MQENASRPDGLPPNQGGKYVGFGSSPGPTPKPQRGGAGGLDDYQQYLSKGISQLSTVAGELRHSGSKIVKIIVVDPVKDSVLRGANSHLQLHSG